MGLTATVLGASGYTGGEVLRLLASHPSITPGALGAHSAVGAETDGVHPHLSGFDLGAFTTLEVAARAPADVCFSCLPSGGLAGLLGQLGAPVVIDLADDHRGSEGWAYGLVEAVRPELPGATRIANPGCYPTAALLALLPFARAQVITGPVIVDAMSGVSGAGKKLDDAHLFSALHGSVAAYGSTEHRHVPEIERGLEALGGLDAHVSFTPHLVPIARGLVATCKAPLSAPATDEQIASILKDAYADESFVTVLDDWPGTKAVAGTNRALVHARVDQRVGMLVASAAIDNLGKGAAGQAIQNANVALGLDEWAGLEQVAAWP
jgi:N-acetyl-gamma-glutamyl-phosphate reductase